MEKLLEAASYIVNNDSSLQVTDSSLFGLLKSEIHKSHIKKTPTMVKNGVELSSLLDGIVNSTVDNIGYETLLNSYVDTYTKKILNEINIVKTCLLYIKRLAESHPKEEYYISNPEDIFNIEYEKLPSIFKENFRIISEINNSSEISYSNIALKDDFVDFSNISYDLNKEDPYVEYKKFLDEYINIFGDDNLPIKNFMLTNITNKISYLNSKLSDLLICPNMSRIDILEALLTKYIAYKSIEAKGYYDTVMNRTSKMLMQDCKEFCYYIAKTLSSYLDRYYKDIESGKLFSYVDNKGIDISLPTKSSFKISIFEDSVEKMNEYGINLDVVFGYVLAPSTYEVSFHRKGLDVTLKELSDNKDRLSKYWSNIRDIYLHNYKSNLSRILSMVYLNNFESLLNEIIKEEKLKENNSNSKFLNKNFIEQAKEIASKIVSSLNIQQLSLKYSIYKKLVTLALYPETSAYHFINMLEDYENENNQNHSLNKALYVIALRDTCRYLLSTLSKR